MAKKKYVSTSSADRTEQKKAAAKKKQISRARDAGLVGLGVAGAVAARAGGRAIRSSLNKPPSPMSLYRANQAISLKETQKLLRGTSKEDILRMNRKGSLDLARKGMIQQKGTTVKGAKGSGYGSGLRKDDIRTTIKPAKRTQGISKTRYSRITGGGGAPGRGMGQGGSGGGGFLKRTK